MWVGTDTLRVTPGGRSGRGRVTDELAVVPLAWRRRCASAGPGMRPSRPPTAPALPAPPRARCDDSRIFCGEKTVRTSPKRAPELRTRRSEPAGARYRARRTSVRHSWIAGRLRATRRGARPLARPGELIEMLCVFMSDQGLLRMMFTAMTRGGKWLSAFAWRIDSERAATCELLYDPVDPTQGAPARSRCSVATPRVRARRFAVLRVRSPARSACGSESDPHSRGSTGSLSSARSAKAHSWTRRSGSRRTKRSRPSIDSANSRSASERFAARPRSRRRASASGSV